MTPADEIRFNKTILVWPGGASVGRAVHEDNGEMRACPLKRGLQNFL